MSTVDADKYEQIVTSLSESIDIFSDGGNAVGEGAFVSSGTSQKISMEEYFNEFENSGQDQELKDDSTEISDEEKYKQKLQDQLKQKTEELYAEVSDKAAAKENSGYGQCKHGRAVPVCSDFIEWCDFI